MCRAGLAVCVLVAGCGRLGYDGLFANDDATDAGATADADVRSTLDGSAPAPSAVISATKLTPVGPHSYVNLDVDWAADIAYAASRKAGDCVHAIDISDELAPQLIGEVAPDRTGSPCLGVRLYSAGQLLVSSESPGAVDLLDRTAPYAVIDSVPVPAARRISIADPDTLFVAQRQDVHRLAVSPSDLAVDTFYDGPCLINHATPARGVVMTGCWPDNSPLTLLDRVSLALEAEHDMINDPSDSGFWTGAATDDDEIVFQGGWIGVLLEWNGSAYDVVYRYDNDMVYRAARFAVEASGPRLYAIMTNGGDNYLEQWNIDSPSAPFLITRTLLDGAEGEAYGLQIDLPKQRAAVVTNDGDILIIDLARLEPTGMSWPTF